MRKESAPARGEVRPILGKDFPLARELGQKGKGEYGEHSKDERMESGEWTGRESGAGRKEGDIKKLFY